MNYSKLCLTTLVSVLVVLALPSSLVAAPVEVVEGQPDVVKGSGAQKYSVGSGASSNGEIFVALQQLQGEVRELRGIVEEQAYLIEQLKQRRLDDYIDLDKRISDLQKAGATMVSSSSSVRRVESQPAINKPAEKVAPVASAAPTVVANIPQSRKPGSAAVADTAKIAYRSAYQKVKDREFNDAKVALTAFVSDFPDSQYVPNAEFWLGELYYLDSNLVKARDAFYILVTQYSNHRKVPDAKIQAWKNIPPVGR